ncbi:hypothetical protein KY285_030385 [Solanum tuberosum]|nr:hypothetical protein KY285_030385 [Solanum tuberosum]
MGPITDATATSSSTASATTHVVQFNPVAQLHVKIQDLVLSRSIDPTRNDGMVDLNITPTFAAITSANKAWEIPHTTRANKSHTRVFSLRDELQNTKKASKTIAEYLQEVHSLFDALKVVGSPINDDELIVKIVSGLGPECHEISAAIHTRDSSLSFEELFHKLTDHEFFLKHQDLEKPSPMITTVVVQKSNTPPYFNTNNSCFNNQQRKPSQSG